MTTINKAKEEIVYIIDENMMIIPISWYDHVMNFQDREKVLSAEYVEDIEIDEETEEVTDNSYWGLRYSQINRRSIMLTDRFDSEEEAEDEIFDRICKYDFEKSNESTMFFLTPENAEEDIIETIADRNDIDKVVAASIYDKQKKVFAARQIKDAIHRANVTKEYAERKAWLAIEVPKEAASIVIDDEFKTAIKWAEEVKGNEKSTRMASAMKGLLARNNKEKIETDFWQVIRILKSKAESM